MFDNPQSPVRLALSHLAAAREQLRDVDLATLSGDELLELMAALEIDVRQRAAVGYALVAEVEARGMAGELGYASTAVLLSERLRIGRREAAAGCGWPRSWGRDGPCPARHCRPRFPQVAAAVARGGDLRSARRGDRRTINRLPDAVLTEQAGAVEPTLVEHARTLDPDQLAVLARTVGACLDPDGVLAAERTTSGADMRPWRCCRTAPAGCGAADR